MNRNWISASRYLGYFAALALLYAAGCVGPKSESADSAATNTLVIRWVRLTESSGDTCRRCGDTEQSVDEARRLLTESLKPTGIRVSVVKERLTPEQFKLAPSQSNRIWIANQPLEDILGAKSGVSRCSGCCGDSDCRTTVLDGRTYETIPPELIVRAGLKVAANMIQPAPSSTPSVAAGKDQFWRITWNPVAAKGPWFDYLRQRGACGGH